MHEQEGVIKFHLKFNRKPLKHLDLASRLALLNTARSAMRAQALIGQDAERYGGDGFGNISMRLAQQQFLISGSQTGHLANLSEADIALVEDFDYQRNQLSASGQTKPSSESMTHGVAYQTLAEINAVIHVHSPEIWSHSDWLGLPATAADIPYGTPEMAAAVRQLIESAYPLARDSAEAARDLPKPALVFVMKGHEDGVVAVGSNLSACTDALLQCLKQTTARHKQ